MAALLAAAPLATVILGMAALRWSATLAGGAGLLAAVLLAAGVFGLEGRAAPGVAAETAHSTATILWIVLPALTLHELQTRTGAVDRLRAALAGLTEDRRLQAILVAWFFGLFMEGAAGFGAPAALAAPLLVGLGFAPVRAVALALLGHASGVSFGALGTPALTQAEITGLPAIEIARATAALHATLGGVMLLATVRLAGGGPLGARDLGWAALAAGLFLVPSLALAALAGPELPSLGGALIGGAAFALVLRRLGSRPSRGAALPRSLGSDLAPYLAIVALVLASRLIPPLRDALGGVVWAWSLPGGHAGSFQPLYHPGTLLVLGLVLGAVGTGRAGEFAPALGAALRRLVPVALTLGLMIGLSRVMVHAGMIDALAEAAALAGPAWPLLAPAIGVLGTFVTGSATASNILFSELQSSTAAALSLPAVATLAAQGYGAAIGNVVAPHNIIAGAAAVGLAAREGDVLRLTAGPCALSAALGGGAVALALALF